LKILLALTSAYGAHTIDYRDFAARGIVLPVGERVA